MFALQYGCYLFLYLVFLRIIQNGFGLKYIDIEIQNDKNQTEIDSDISQYDDSLRKPNYPKKIEQGRRNWLVTPNLHLRSTQISDDINEKEKDENLKRKISALVDQTVHDTNKKIELISHVKEQLRNEGPYKAGFILSMIKKSKDMLSELFNVAVKHKDDWKALEQLKIFELIVHTNVDTTHLIRQLIEVHVQFLNSTHTDDNKKRMVLLK
ncbi:uncharacterized protein LOC123868321 [Maniola jurtina]|uniref:uncharacterized protein LOC123868321 n=1 Tax=Maniola jurtina TaxID=191418 RepID=UPI001E68B7E4|nr:uncharacterized protein LOC123868321 [Maniola jurtina]